LWKRALLWKHALKIDCEELRFGGGAQDFQRRKVQAAEDARLDSRSASMRGEGATHPNMQPLISGP
jgi:hypothetical protein